MSSSHINNLNNNLNNINYSQYISEVTNTNSKFNNDNNDNITDINLHPNSLLDKCSGNNIVGTMNTTKKSKYYQCLDESEYFGYSGQSSEPKKNCSKKRLKLSHICTIL